MTLKNNKHGNIFNCIQALVALISPVFKLFVIPLFLLLAACTATPSISDLPAKYDIAPDAEAVTLKTTDDLTLFGQWWIPESQHPPKAVVLLVHGTYVHSGFYSNWAHHLSQHGYAVFGIDLRGWGQSQGFGRRGYVRNFDEYVDDLVLAYQKVKARYPGKQIFLQGESLGGLVVLLSQEKGQTPADGLVLNAPAIRPALSMGPLHTPNWIADFSLWTLGVPGSLFPNQPTLVPGAVVEMFAGLAVKSDELVRDFKADPHVVHTALPLGFITAVQKGTAEVQEGLKYVHKPLIILQGTRDSLVPLSSSEYAMDNVQSSDKTLKVYEGMSHATLHDTGHEQVWLDITSWLDERVR